MPFLSLTPVPRQTEGLITQKPWGGAIKKTPGRQVASLDGMRTCQAPEETHVPSPPNICNQTAPPLGSSFAYFHITFFSPKLTQAAVVVARTVSPLPLANFYWLLVFKIISLARTFSILPHIPHGHSASCHAQPLTSLLHRNQGNVAEKLSSVFATASPVM